MVLVILRKGWRKWAWVASVLKYKGKASSRTVRLSRRHCKDEYIIAFRLWALQVITAWILGECNLVFLLSGQWGLKILFYVCIKRCMATYLTEMEVYLHLILVFEDNATKIIPGVWNKSKLIMSGMQNLTGKPLQQEVPGFFSK